MIELNKPEEGDDGVTLTGGTPYSLQVITAGASSLTKWWAGLVGSLGGLAAIGSAIKAFWLNEGDTVQAVLIASTALFVSAAFLSVAIIVQADVKARGVASAARKEATAGVVTAMFASYEFGIQSPTQYAIKHGTWYGVKSLLYRDNGVAILADDGDIVPLTEVSDAVDLRSLLKPAG